MPYWQHHPLHKDRGILCIPHSFDVNDVKYTTSPGFANPKVREQLPGLSDMA
jgi:hypothetical protein